MDNERREDLYRLWCNETNEAETQEWREDLSLEELDLVAQWDMGHAQGVHTLCSRLLIREKLRGRYSRKEIAELEAVGDHYRLRLRDGSLYLARLAQDGALRLDPIDAAC